MKSRDDRSRSANRHAISNQLRDIIDSRGLTGHAVGKLAGVDPGVVKRFLTGVRDIRLETVDRLAAALGLRLVEVGRRASPAPSSSKRSTRPVASPVESGPVEFDPSPVEFDPSPTVEGSEPERPQRVDRPDAAPLPSRRWSGMPVFIDEQV